MEKCEENAQLSHRREFLRRLTQPTKMAVYCRWELLPWLGEEGHHPHRLRRMMKQEEHADACMNRWADVRDLLVRAIDHHCSGPQRAWAPGRSPPHIRRAILHHLRRYHRPPPHWTDRRFRTMESCWVRCNNIPCCRLPAYRRW